MKKIILLLFVIFSITSVMSQKTVKGTITDNHNEPLVGVNIRVIETDKGATTNFDGEFSLSGLEKTNILELSFLGYKTREIKVSDIVNDVAIILFEGNELLQEIVIDTNRKNKFSRKKSAYVAKMPLKNIENSQVYSTITNQLLVSQSVTSFEQALQNSTGLSKLWSSTGRGTDGAGYYSLRGFSLQPTLVNGLAGITNGYINPDNVERVEVIKGPSATLFGSTLTSYGGLINIVTKKPYNGTGESLTVAGGSYGYRKIVADYNTNLVDNLSFRINVGYQAEDSFQDAGFKKYFFVAPSLSYKVNNKLTFNFNYEYSSGEQTNTTSLFFNRYSPIAFNTVEELNYDITKSFTNNDVSIKNPTQNFRGEIAYKISDNWSSQTIIAGGNAKSNGLYTYLWNFANYDAKGNIISGSPYFSSFASKTDAETKTLDIQQNFTGDFKLGSIRNRVVIGADYLKTKIIDKGSSWKYIASFTAQGDLIAGTAVSKKVIEAALSDAKYSNIETNQNVFSVYASDVINITRQLFFMASIRYDRFQYDGDKNDTTDDEAEFTEDTFSPKFGIVYQPIFNKLSLFANYQNGFSYVKPEVQAIDENDPSLGNILLSYKLEQANQFETGIKANLFNNRLEATLSYYDITVKNKVIGYGSRKKQDGTVNSKGFEIELNASPIKGLNIRAGFSHNDAKLTKSVSSPELIGVRTSESGPKNLYNFWSDYKFQQEKLKNLGLGIGFIGASSYNTMSENTISGEFIIPGYTVINQSVYYESDKLRVSLKMNNILNKHYYTGWTTLTPESPRSFIGTITYKF